MIRPGARTAPGAGGGAAAPILHLLDGAAGAFGAAAFAWLIVLWLRMIVSPAPQEMREGALILTTLALLEGRNPYAADLAHVAGNLYGILYPLMVVPFAALLGPGLGTHRLVAGLGILAAAWLVWHGARQAGAGRAAACLAASLSMTGWLYWVGPTVRPDGVGLACMLGALVIAAPAPASPRRFALALLASLAGFATKLYFGGGILIIAAHVFLFRNRKRGLAFAAAAVAALAAWAGLLAALMPEWATLVLGDNIGATNYDPAHLLRQGRDWLLFSLPLLAGLAAVLALPPRPHWSGETGFWGFAALSGLAALLASLGGHSGAHMTYFFHILTPPLAIAVAAAARHGAAPLRAMMLALPVTVLVNAHWFVIDPSRFPPAEAWFAVAGEAIAQAREPLVTTEFAALAALSGHHPVETGHSEYMLDEAGRAALRARLATDLRAGRFDLIIVNRNEGGLVHASDVAAAGYRRIEPIPVDLVWAMQAWEADLWRPPPR